MARSTANSRRRWLTESPRVPATTNMATKAAMPPKEVATSMSSPLEEPTSGNSSLLRSLPV